MRDLFQQIGGKHQDLCVGAKALDGPQIAYSLLEVLWG